MHSFDADVASAPPVNSPEFWKRPERVTASSDPDTATAQTVRIMCGHVKRAAADESVRAAAHQAFGQFAGLAGGGNDSGSIAGAAWWWCKTFIKFVHHDFIIRDRLGETGQLQGLISPEVLVQMDRPEGDCAIFTECLCSFLRVFGIPYEIVTVAVNPREPGIFSHVFAYAVMPDGSRLPLDASHGDYPGWQVPSSDVSRRQVWDESGNPIADRASRFDGLHNYGVRHWGGLGQDSVDLSTLYPAVSTDPLTTDYYNPTQVFGPGVADPGFYVDSSTGTPYSGTTYTAPSQNSTQWAAFAASLAKSGLTLAEINSIQPGTVVGANGSILRQNPGYSVPVGGVSTAFSSLGSGNTMLYLGLGLVGLILVGSMAGRK